MKNSWVGISNMAILKLTGVIIWVLFFAVIVTLWLMIMVKCA